MLHHLQLCNISGYELNLTSLMRRCHKVRTDRSKWWKEGWRTYATVKHTVLACCPVSKPSYNTEPGGSKQNSRKHLSQQTTSEETGVWMLRGEKPMPDSLHRWLEEGEGVWRVWKVVKEQRRSGVMSTSQSAAYQPAIKGCHGDGNCRATPWSDSSFNWDKAKGAAQTLAD